MPGDSETQYDRPVSLRDNETRPRPNPWTRLEAAEIPRERLRALITYLDHRARQPDINGLIGVVTVLADQLDVCLKGDLTAVEDVRDGTAELETWFTAVESVVYPTAGPSGSAADGDQADAHVSRSDQVVEALIAAPMTAQRDVLLHLAMQQPARTAEILRSWHEQHE
jgi:hypothetical protein